VNGPSPVRLQLSRKRGYQLQAASQAANGLTAIKVDRSTRWGNPYKVGDKGVPDVETAVRLFTRLVTHPNGADSDPFFVFTIDRIRADLGGRNLACWCTLNQLCHADVLLRVANSSDRTSEAPLTSVAAIPAPAGAAALRIARIAAIATSSVTQRAGRQFRRRTDR
jgi:Domain of unknown function (DUF4326)